MKLKHISFITPLHQREEIQHLTKEAKALKEINALNQDQQVHTSHKQNKDNQTQKTLPNFINNQHTTPPKQ